MLTTNFRPSQLISSHALPREQVSYNIGHLAYLNAKRYDLPRIFFGGFYIRGHPYTMETISYAIRFWSKVALSTWQGTPAAHAIWLCRNPARVRRGCSRC